jgi:glutamate-1-semialdehyde 2,1-aminomutase
MITGFRFAGGGAQELFGVSPDLATFGKGLANGYPLSALVGSRAIMQNMEEVFFSGTFGGEALSLAAAKAVLHKIKSEPVLESIHSQGARILEGTRMCIESAGLSESIAVAGHPSWSALQFKDSAGYGAWQIRTYFLQELLARGVLSLASHNVSYAHDAAAIDQLLEAYSEILPALREVLEARTLEENLHCDPLGPIFQVRPLSSESREGS